MNGEQLQELWGCLSPAARGFVAVCREEDEARCCRPFTMAEYIATSTWAEDEGNIAQVAAYIEWETGQRVEWGDLCAGCLAVVVVGEDYAVCSDDGCAVHRG